MLPKGIVFFCLFFLSVFVLLLCVLPQLLPLVLVFMTDVSHFSSLVSRYIWCLCITKCALCVGSLPHVWVLLFFVPCVKIWFPPHPPLSLFYESLCFWALCACCLLGPNIFENWCLESNWQINFNTQINLTFTCCLPQSSTWTVTLPTFSQSFMETFDRSFHHLAVSPGWVISSSPKPNTAKERDCISCLSHWTVCQNSLETHQKSLSMASLNPLLGLRFCICNHRSLTEIPLRFYAWFWFKWLYNVVWLMCVTRTVITVKSRTIFNFYINPILDWHPSHAATQKKWKPVPQFLFKVSISQDG